MSDSIENLLTRDHDQIDDLYGEAREYLNGEDAAATLEAFDLFWARLGVHIRAEHLHLFPHLSEAASKDRIHATATLRRIARLREDHNFFMREIIAAIKLLRRLAADDGRSEAPDLTGLRERMDRVHRRLTEHDESEESEIYPLIRQLLADDEAVLFAKIKKELDNLPPRFADSLRAIPDE